MLPDNIKRLAVLQRIKTKRKLTEAEMKEAVALLREAQQTQFHNLMKVRDEEIKQATAAIRMKREIAKSDIMKEIDRKGPQKNVEKMLDYYKEQLKPYDDQIDAIEEEIKEKYDNIRPHPLKLPNIPVVVSREGAWQDPDKLFIQTMKSMILPPSSFKKHSQKKTQKKSLKRKRSSDKKLRKRSSSKSPKKRRRLSSPRTPKYAEWIQ